MDCLEGVNKPEISHLQLKGFLLYIVVRQHPFQAQGLSPLWKHAYILFNAIVQGN